MSTPTPSGSWVWGIDLSSRSVDICTRGVTGQRHRWWADVPLAGGVDRARCYAHALKDIADVVRGLNAAYPPTIVVIEDPYVPFGDPSYMQGVMAIVQGLTHRLTLAPIHTVASGTWKATCGDGQAKKPQVAEWASGLGYEGTKQDLADATCIAEHAAYLYRLAVQHGDIKEHT